MCVDLTKRDFNIYFIPLFHTCAPKPLPCRTTFPLCLLKFTSFEDNLHSSPYYGCLPQTSS